MTQISRLSGIPRDYYNNPEDNQIGALSFGTIFSSVKTGVTKFAGSDAGKQLIQQGGSALVNKLTAAKPTSSATMPASGAGSGMPANWDEQGYLSLNPDVAQAIASGKTSVRSGWEHYMTYGQREGRPTAAPLTAGSQSGNGFAPSGNTGLILAACAVGAFLLLDKKKKKKD